MTLKEKIIMKLIVQEELTRRRPAAHWEIQKAIEIVETTEDEKGIEHLERMPSAEPQWIPCSERLPEEKDAGILKKLGTSKRSDYVLATVEVKK